MPSKKAIRAIEEIGRMNVKPMTPAHLLDHLYGMKASVLDLLIGNDNLRYDTAGIQREIGGVGEYIERLCDLVDELRQKEHCLSMAEPSLLRSNRLLKSNEKALIEEVMSLRRRAHRLSPIEEPDCSKEGEVDLLKSPHARVNQKSIIPRSKSRPKVVKRPGRRRKGVSSATQLQTIHEDNEPIIPLTAKSAVVLSGESEIHTTAVANMETKKNKKHSIPWSTKVRDTISESDDIPTIRLQEQPPIPRPKFHKMVLDSQRFLLTDTSDINDDVLTIHMEEESGDASAANKPTTKKQNPATDFSLFIGGKKSIPRKVMFAEQLKKKKSLLPRLCKFFKTPKADRVEEIELPKRERRESLTAPVSRKLAAPSGSKIPLLRRAPKKKKSLIPTLRKFFKTPKADRVEEIELPKRERREVLTAPVSRKLAAPSGSKIPLLRRAPKKKKSLIPTLRKFSKTPKADRVEEIELPKRERREVLTAPVSRKLAAPSGSKIPLFRGAPKKKKSLIPTLRKFFKTPKADRVEEIELPKRERREVLTAPVSHKLATTSGSKIPLFRRAPKKKKSLIPTLRKFFKTPKADRVEEIELPKRERREVLTAPVSRKLAAPSGSKIPLFRGAPKKKKSLIPTLRKFFKTPKADRVEEIELPKTERREVLTAPGSHKPAGSSGSKIPLFRHAQILHQRFLPMPEPEKLSYVTSVH